MTNPAVAELAEERETERSRRLLAEVAETLDVAIDAGPIECYDLLLDASDRLRAGLAP